MTRVFQSVLCIVVACSLATGASGGKKADPPSVPTYRLNLPEGRRLEFVRSIGTDRDLAPKRNFWKRTLDFIAGPADIHYLRRPYSVATDSHGRLIITDPGSVGIHVFDLAQNKYKFIERREAKQDPLRSPQCVAVDGQDNIYVTDSESGKIFVFDAEGKFRRVIGSLRGGEGFFKRPTGIAIDVANSRIYVTDTLRDQIFILDMDGNVVQKIGQRGAAKGEFNFPTEISVTADGFAVVDAMNFRLQLFDRAGQLKAVIGQSDGPKLAMFRPKGISFDSEGHLYVVDGLWSVVQVFDAQGQRLYSFGRKGTLPGEFQLPAGLTIDHNDRVYVVDSFNRRVQVFQYVALGKRTER